MARMWKNSGKTDNRPLPRRPRSTAPDPHTKDPDVLRYRRERARHSPRTLREHTRLMAEAKAAFDAAIHVPVVNRGRPRKDAKPFNVRPEDWEGEVS